MHLLCKKEEEITKYTCIIPGGKTHRKDNSENDEAGYLSEGGCKQVVREKEG